MPGTARPTASQPRTATLLSADPTVTTPTITGTATEGQLLTASATAGQVDNTVTYAWYSSADSFTTAIGTGSTYTVKEADEAHTIEIRATATNDNGLTVTSAFSTATATVLDADPTVTTPTITGTATEGQLLTASATAGQVDNTVTYAWYSSADSFTTAIGTGSTYTVKEADEAHTIEVRATATNDNGLTVTSAFSTATATVLDADPTVTTPTITGTATEGQLLTASATAGQVDNTVTYAWYSSADSFTTADRYAALRRSDGDDADHHRHGHGRPAAHRLGHRRPGRQHRHLCLVQLGRQLHNRGPLRCSPPIRR